MCNTTTWETAYRHYEHEVKTYWDEISEKRKQRNEKRRNGQKITLTDYVLIQPPVYDRSTTPCNTLDGQTRQDSAVYFPDG